MRYFEDAVSGDPVQDDRLGAELDPSGRRLLITHPKNAVATLDAALERLTHEATASASPAEQQAADRAMRAARLLREKVGGTAADHASALHDRRSRQERELSTAVKDWRRARADERTDTEDGVQQRAAVDHQEDHSAAKHRAVSNDPSARGGLAPG